ncbi:MAG: beta-propeller fold lactonase family protein [Vicinamibacterales bacterium]
MYTQRLRPIQMVGLTLAALGVVLSQSSAIAQGGGVGSAKTTAVVYVETNSPDGNAILAYHRSVKGRLSLLGVFPTGGTGVFDLSLQLGPFDSDQDIITNPERTRLFAVNSGSNTIAVFEIAANGALTALPGSPFPSGGTNPVSVGLVRDALAVVNKGMDPQQSAADANYSSFRVTPEGQLTTLLSTHPIEPSVSATQALVSPSKRLVFGADFLGGLLRSFLVEPTGALRQVDLQSPPSSESDGAAPVLPLGLWAHPKQPVVYVGFVTVNKLAVYTYDPRGRLAFVRTVPNSGQAICWLRTNDDGTRLYTSNTGDNSISVYDTSSPLAPVELQRLQLKGAGSAFQLDLDPTGEFLYVVTQRATPEVPLGEGNNLHVLRINRANGRLSEDGESVYALPVLPPGTRPKGVVSMQPR